MKKTKWDSNSKSELLSHLLQGYQELSPDASAWGWNQEDPALLPLEPNAVAVQHGNIWQPFPEAPWAGTTHGSQLSCVSNMMRLLTRKQVGSLRTFQQKMISSPQLPSPASLVGISCHTGKEVSALQKSFGTKTPQNGSISVSAR